MFVVEQKKDIEEVENLISIYKAIYSQYEILSKLEINNEEDSKEYQKVLDNIKLGEEVAKKIFSKIDHTDTKIIENIVELFPDANFYDDYISLACNKHPLLTIRRFIISTAYAKSFNEGLDKYNPKIPVEIRDEYFSYADYKLHKELEKTTFRNYLYYLEKEIKKEHNEDIKNELIKNKYDLIFIRQALNDNDEFYKPVIELKDEIEKIITDHQISAERVSEFFNELFSTELNIAINLFLNSEVFSVDIENKTKKALLACTIKAILFNSQKQSIDKILLQTDETEKQLENKKIPKEKQTNIKLNMTMLRGMLKSVLNDKDKYLERKGDKNDKTRRINNIK